MAYEIEFPCEVCGTKHLRVLPNKSSAVKRIQEGKKKTFCSAECRREYFKQTSWEDRVCRNCEETFTVPKSNTKRHCKPKCYYEHINKHPEYYDLPSRAQTMRSKTNKAEATRKMLDTKLEKGLIVDWNNATWKQWYRRCNAILQKRRKEMVGDWDGFDYIDNKYIKDNLTLPYYHKDYPTLDHVIPKQTLFLEGYTPEEACKEENLKWTTRSNNSKKGYN